MIKFQAKYAFLVLAVIWLRAIHQDISFGVLIFLCVFSLLGARQSIVALSLLFLLTASNTLLFGKPQYIGYLRWAVILCAGFRLYIAVLLRSVRLTPQIVLLGCFCVGSFLLAYLFGHNPKISILKLGSFFFAASAILWAFQRAEFDRDFLFSYFYTYFAVILLSSLPLIVTRSAFAINGKGFQGIISHPQAFGIFLGGFLALFIGKWIVLSSSGSLPWHYRPVVIAGLVSMVLTQARTGVFAVVGALGIMMVYSIVGNPSWRKSLFRFFVNPHSVIMVFVLVALFLGFSHVVEPQIEKFVLKGRGTEYSTDLMLISRAQLIELSWRNFLRNPWTGIGFGAPSLPYLLKKQDNDFMGMPMGASIEKGFLFTAVLEENGAIVGTIFFVFLASLFWRVLRAGGLASILGLTACILINCGEYVFFSMGQIGLLFFVLISYCVGDRKNETAGA